MAYNSYWTAAPPIRSKNPFRVRVSEFSTTSSFVKNRGCSRMIFYAMQVVHGGVWFGGNCSALACDLGFFHELSFANWFDDRRYWIFLHLWICWENFYSGAEKKCILRDHSNCVLILSIVFTAKLAGSVLQSSRRYSCSWMKFKINIYNKYFFFFTIRIRP